LHRGGGKPARRNDWGGLRRPLCPLFGAIFGVGAVIVLPIMYGVFGALGAMLSAALYNVTAGAVGGVELTIEPAPGFR
jgi:hypothetical protein